MASFAIQLAKHLGAQVISTASTGNVDYVRGLGADQVIDYNTTDFTKVAKGCDAVFETVGGDVATRSFAVLKPGGRAAFIASGAQAPKPDRSDVIALRPAVPRERRAYGTHRGALRQGRRPRPARHALRPREGRARRSA